MRNVIATLLILLGFVIAAGAEDPTLTWIDIMLQGVIGIIFAGAGVKLYTDDGEE